MNYREEQRRRAVEIRDTLFKDPGTGLFFGKQRDFVLKDPSLNLWAGIRDDAKHYFSTNRIHWWKGTGYDPTGHLLSSQVACLNHLYFLRQRKDIATTVLKAIDPTIQEAMPVDTGYVEFEYIGKRQTLRKEHSPEAPTVHLLMRLCLDQPLTRNECSFCWNGNSLNIMQ